MDNIIGMLILSMSLSGTLPSDINEVPAPVIDSSEVYIETIPEEKSEKKIQETIDTVLGISEEERLAIEAQKKAEKEAKLREDMIKNAELLDYDHDIASYITYYSQSASNENRNFNMLLASDSINGVILRPGEEFSYNNVILSKRTPERDYKAAGVISGGKLVNATGGGICQISTTLFNAALHSGMTITQRRNHSLKVGYVPAGMDATCSWGTIDFCFRNDLKVPVKIESVMKDGSIKVRFLSPGDPNIGNIELKVFNNNGTYTLNRYVDGVVDYTTTSRYRG